MPGLACAGRNGPIPPRFHNQILETRSPWRHLPLDLWFNILEFAETPAVAKFARLSKDCKRVAFHNDLWKAHFKKSWSPEYSGTLQTMPDGKDFRSLYGCWQTGYCTVDLIPEVNRILNDDFPEMNAVQLSQAGALAAWSVGSDNQLVGTDITTRQILKRFVPPPDGDICGTLWAAAVLDAKGLVCAGGTHITCWDPRQPGNESSATPAFCVDYNGFRGSWVRSMISAASFGGCGPEQLLTGETDEKVYLWDLRFIDHGPVREYKSTDGGVTSLLREPRHGTLLAGGAGGITCSDFTTGALLSTLRAGPGTTVGSSLAAGRDHLITVDDKNITEWAVPDPHAVVKEPEPRWVRPLPTSDIHGHHPVWIQGLGEDLHRVLVGTGCGSICEWECLEDPEEPFMYWDLEDHPARVTCLTATDELVVLGLDNGALRVVRLG